MKKELDAFTGKMNPLNKHFPTDKNHVLVVIKMLTAESAGLCKLLTRYKRTRNDQIIRLKLLSNPYTKPFIQGDWVKNGIFPIFFFLASVCLFCLFFLLFALLPLISFKGK